jgi:elongation factor G
MALETSRIRNIGFIGHGGVGKTSLVEAILFRTGMISRLGKVDDGTATTDFDPEEVKRRISVNTAAAFCDYRDHRLNLVDMPGYGDFIAEARAGLRVVEGAVIVVDAVAGVEVQTEKVSKFAREYGLPRLVFVNRMDRERADFGRALDSVRRRLKGRFVPLQVPVGQEAGFRGAVDVVKMKAFVQGAGPGKFDEVDIPADLAGTAREYREQLVEAVAETDDELLARYLEEGALDEGRSEPCGRPSGRALGALRVGHQDPRGAVAPRAGDRRVPLAGGSRARRGHGPPDQGDGHPRAQRQ